MILRRPKTNCDCLFLYLKIEINDNRAEPKNNSKYAILSLAKTGISFSVVQRWNTNINPPEIIAEIIKYMV